MRKEFDLALQILHSVKNDNIDKSYKYKDEVITLASRIEELLDSQIYDAKLEQ